MSKQKKIEKLNVQLLVPQEELKKKYNKTKAEWIVKYGYEYTFLGNRRSRPDVGVTSWNEYYPNGFKDWKIMNGNNKLTSYGQQNLINKINEIIERLNNNLKNLKNL